MNIVEIYKKYHLMYNIFCWHDSSRICIIDT